MTELPHAKVVENPAKKIGQQVVMDTWGPITPIGKGGDDGKQNKEYAVNVMDVASRYLISVPVSDKKQALYAFKKMETILEEQEHRILSTLSDNGGEFQNDKFKDYTEERGIIMRFTAPHTPQSAGLIERTNRTLPEMTRAWIIEHDIPKFLWPYLMEHAAWIKNMIPHIALKGKSPYEVLYKRKPDLSGIPTPGSYIWILDQSGHAKKLDNKAAKFKFLGFDHTDKTARYYHHITRQVRTSHNWAIAPVSESGGDSGAKGDSPPATPPKSSITYIEFGDPEEETNPDEGLGGTGGESEVEEEFQLPPLPESPEETPTPTVTPPASSRPETPTPPQTPTPPHTEPESEAGGSGGAINPTTPPEQSGNRWLQGPPSIRRRPEEDDLPEPGPSRVPGRWIDNSCARSVEV